VQGRNRTALVVQRDGRVEDVAQRDEIALALNDLVDPEVVEYVLRQVNRGRGRVLVGHGRHKDAVAIWVGVARLGKEKLADGWRPALVLVVHGGVDATDYTSKVSKQKLALLKCNEITHAADNGRRSHSSRPPQHAASGKTPADSCQLRHDFCRR